MVNITLMTYLQQALPPLPVMPPRAGHNTENAAYHSNDIHNITFWPAFNLNTILNRYQLVLTTTRLAPDRMPLSPRKPINAENTIKKRVSESVHPRIRRDLPAGFEMTPTAHHEGRWVMRSMLWIRKDIEAEQVPLQCADLTAALLRFPDRSVLVMGTTRRQATTARRQST